MAYAYKAPEVVLVVEDEPILRMMAVDLVEEAGFIAVEAANAAQAVEILEKRTDIRIVFTDIDMPGGLDGMQLSAMIRDRWPPIDLVITSGYRSPSASDMPERAKFFAKPYRQQAVADALRSF